MRLEDLIGHRLGRYEITALIGRGGMAAVYRAHDTALRRDVALKVLYPQFAGDTALVERFQREAVLAANLDHPNILPIYDVGEAEDMVYIAMRLQTGPSFADLLRLRGALPPAELIPIVEQIASALDYAHARQIVHRDIKPANILIEGMGDAGWTMAAPAPNPQSPVPNPHAVLTDFGIAKSLDPLATGLTVTGVLIGTPEYMAPEQIRGGQNVDGRADIYALGVLVYRALTGRRPFEGGTQEILMGHLQGQIADPSSIDPALPPAIDGIIRKALARDPDQRYRSAGEFARALRAATGVEPATPPPALRRAVDGRAVVPQVAVDDMARPAVSTADQPTRKGTVVPAGRVAQPARPQPARNSAPEAVRGVAAPRRSEPRGSSAAWALLGLVLAIAIGGGILYASGLMAGGAGNSGAIATGVPSDTAAPSPSAAPSETLAPTEAPTAQAATSEPTAAPTEAPTAVPPTAAPTAKPTARPTVRPTAIPPTPTQTPSPSPTPSTTPTNTPAPPTPTPTEGIPLQGGFKMLLEQNEGLAIDLGPALAPERGGPKTATEQQFEEGSMFYFQPTEQIYVLFGKDRGIHRVFEKSELEDLPAPAPAECEAPQQGGFALVWGNFPDVRRQLGCSTSPEPNLFDGAYQEFRNGTLLFSQNGLGRGKTIYVVWNGGEFQRFDDPNQ
jgi:serine/threonine-protein kinase